MEEDYAHPYSARNRFSEALSLAFLYGFIEIIGITGNILAICAIRTDRRFQTNYYFLVCHLAITDILLLLIGNAFFTISPWIDPSISWCIFPILCGTAYVIQVMFVIIIGISRYFAIVKPFAPQPSRQQLSILAVGVYFLAFGIHIPRFSSAKLLQGQCVDQSFGNGFYQAYLASMAILKMIFPLVLLTVLYCRICRSLYAHHKSFKAAMVGNSSGENGGKSKAECVAAHLVHARAMRNTKIVILSICITVLFCVSNLPMLITVELLTRGLDVQSYYFWLGLWYYLGSSTLNPIIYGLGDKGIRSGYRKCLQKLLRCVKTEYRPRRRRTMDGDGSCNNTASVGLNKIH